MLVLIGLFFLYIDIYMSSVDLVADAIGLLLLTVSFLIYGRRKQCSILWALLSLGAAVCSALSWFSLEFWIWDILSWLIPSVASFFLVWRLYLLACNKALTAFRHPPEPELVSYYQRIIRLTLLFILICELCTPVLGLIPALSYILLILRTVAGLFVILRTYKMLYWNAYC